MKKNALYIGNNLQNKKSNISYMQTLGSLLEDEGLKLYYSSSKNNKVLRLLDMIFTVFKKRKVIDVILIDTYSTSNFYFAFITSQICRIMKKPYVPILHGGNLTFRLKKHVLKSKALFNNAVVNVSPSLYLKSEFSKYGHSNVIHIPNTLEIKNYLFKKRSLNEIRLLWVRSFSEIYNPKMAVNVLKQLLDKGYKANLCMIGPDSDGSLDATKSFAEQLNVDVEFTGKLKKEDWIKKSENFNVFINTTNFDNMPVSVIEAMALGLPIVSTNVGGIPFLIENYKNGILVDKNNSDQMAEAIIQLYDNQYLVDSVSSNARNKAEQYDWSIVKQQWISLLQKI